MKLAAIKKELKGMDIHKMYVLVQDDCTDLVVSLKNSRDEEYITLLEDEGNETYAKRLTTDLIKNYGTGVVKPYEVSNC